MGYNDDDWDDEDGPCACPGCRPRRLRFMAVVRALLVAGQAFHDTLLDEVERHLAHKLERESFKGSVEQGLESLVVEAKPPVD